MLGEKNTKETGAVATEFIVVSTMLIFAIFASSELFGVFRTYGDAQHIVADKAVMALQAQPSLEVGVVRSDNPSALSSNPNHAVIHAVISEMLSWSDSKMTVDTIQTERISVANQPDEVRLVVSLQYSSFFYTVDLELKGSGLYSQDAT